MAYRPLIFPLLMELIIRHCWILLFVKIPVVHFFFQYHYPLPLKVSFYNNIYRLKKLSLKIYQLKDFSLGRYLCKIPNSLQAGSLVWLPRTGEAGAILLASYRLQLPIHTSEPVRWLDPQITPQLNIMITHVHICLLQ